MGHPDVTRHITGNVFDAPPQIWDRGYWCAPAAPVPTPPCGHEWPWVVFGSPFAGASTQAADGLALAHLVLGFLCLVHYDHPCNHATFGHLKARLWSLGPLCWCNRRVSHYWTRAGAPPHWAPLAAPHGRWRCPGLRIVPPVFVSLGSPLRPPALHASMAAPADRLR